MGAGRARLAGKGLLEAGARALISWGTAGALAPELDPGTLLIPERVVDSLGRVLTTDAAWRERMRSHASDRLLSVSPGLLAQADEVIRTPAEKRALYQRLGAAAVDMESAALGALAREARVPFVVVRAVTDTARVSIPASVTGSMDPAGGIEVRKLLSGLLRHPADAISLIRLARGFRAAASALAAFAEGAGSFLTPCPAISPSTAALPCQRP
jgi:adenosylhomocysteine nucleosidase